VSTDAVTYQVKGHIALVTINRPDKRNALSIEVVDGLQAAWQRFSEGAERAAVLTGAGERAFCAGADLNAPAEVWRCMPGVGVALDKPVVAAVNGWAVGGGIALVQFSDLCVAVEGARFVYPEAKVGFSGGLIASMAARLPHKIAMELMLLGEEMSAERAYQVGLVNKLVAVADLMPAALDFAEKAAANAPLVVQMVKRFADEVIPKGSSEIAAIARRDIERAYASDDLKEGVAAFREKRKPNFMGS